MLRSTLIALLVLAAGGARAQPALDISKHFEGIEGTFILVDGRSDLIYIHHPERARERFLPASTFKIPNTLIALETSVAGGADFFLAWDSTAAPAQAWWPEAWSRDHTLRTALPASVVWFYQEIARRVGPERMADYVHRFNYGSADMSGGIDQFWLSGGLRISAEEQVDFLQRFFHGQLGVSPNTTTLTKELLVLEETPAYRLSGKTGLTAQGESRPDIGWFVGYVERDGTVSFFALNLDAHTREHVAARTAIAREILVDAGLVDGDESRR